MTVELSDQERWQGVLREKKLSELRAKIENIPGFKPDWYKRFIDEKSQTIDWLGLSQEGNGQK